MSTTTQSPLRWAITTAERATRELHQYRLGPSGLGVPSGAQVSADFEGKLAAAHLEADRCETLEQEHFALKLALRSVLNRWDDQSHRIKEACGEDNPRFAMVDESMEAARKVLATLSTP